jgi:hypothetical protein
LHDASAFDGLAAADKIFGYVKEKPSKDGLIIYDIMNIDSFISSDRLASSYITQDWSLYDTPNFDWSISGDTTALKYFTILIKQGSNTVFSKFHIGKNEKSLTSITSLTKIFDVLSRQEKTFKATLYALSEDVSTEIDITPVNTIDEKDLDFIIKNRGISIVDYKVNKSRGPVNLGSTWTSKRIPDFSWGLVDIGAEVDYFLIKISKGGSDVYTSSRIDNSDKTYDDRANTTDVFTSTGTYSATITAYSSLDVVKATESIDLKYVSSKVKITEFDIDDVSFTSSKVPFSWDTKKLPKLKWKLSDERLSINRITISVTDPLSRLKLREDITTIVRGDIFANSPVYTKSDDIFVQTGIYNVEITAFNSSNTKVATDKLTIEYTVSPVVISDLKLNDINPPLTLNSSIWSNTDTPKVTWNISDLSNQVTTYKIEIRKGLDIVYTASVKAGGSSMTHAKETIASPNHPFRKGYGEYKVVVQAYKDTTKITEEEASVIYKDTAVQITSLKAENSTAPVLLASVWDA